MIGLESQTAPDPYMPIRCLSYDAAAYRDQVATRKSIQRQNTGRPPQKRLTLPPLHSVFTICLHFGFEHWSGPRTLKECLLIPSGLEPYVADYPIHLFEIAFLSDEQVASFRSDFRYVADFFIQMRRIKEVNMEKFFSYAVDMEVDRRLPQIIKEKLPQAIAEKLPQIKAETIIPVLENIAKASHCSIEEVCRMAGMSVEEYNEAKQTLMGESKTT